jgi:hypothetical protein
VAAGFSADVPDTTKVIVHAERPLDGADVRAFGGELIRQYPSYTLYRVPTSALAGLRTAAQAKNALIEVVEAWDTVAIAHKTIDTRKSRGHRRVLANSADARRASAQPRLYLVQFAGPLTDDDQRLMTEAGLAYVGYIPHNAVLVLASADAVDRIADAPAVQWTSTFDRAHKMPVAATPEVDPATFVVQFVNKPDTSRQLRQFRATHTVLHEVSYGSYTNFRVRIKPTDAAALLDNPVVVTVERGGGERVSGEREAIASGGPKPGSYYPPWGFPYQEGSSGNWMPHRPASWISYLNWTTYAVPDASQYRIAVADSGLRRTQACPTCPASHPDFGGVSIIWGQDWLTGGNYGQDNSGHGTMVAGMAAARAASGPELTAGGDGTFNYAMGVAPQASLFIQRIIEGSAVIETSDIFDWATEAKNNGCVVQTHSHNRYGDRDQNNNFTSGTYTCEAQEYDFAVRDINLPLTVAAGNICDGPPPQPNCTTMVLSPATAKNVIAVGASESYRPNTTCDVGYGTVPGGQFAASFDNVAALSRRGTQDGRIKPDIIAPGTMVSSTHAIGVSSPYCMNVGPDNPGIVTRNKSYDISSGTSFSAPQAAAAVALVRSKFSRHGSLSPAMLKAMLVGSAKSARGLDRLNNTYVGPRPNITQGFGRLHISDLVGGGIYYRLLDENFNAPFNGAGDSRTGTFTIAEPNKPTVIVLAWTDEPGPTTGGPTLVRDLNLTVKKLTDGCERYSGNYVNAWDNSIQQDCNGMSFYADHANNVEAIYLPPGYAPGYNTTVLEWRVDSFNWAQGTQPFAIFGSNVD